MTTTHNYYIAISGVSDVSGVGRMSDVSGASEWSGRGPHLVHLLQDDLADEGVVAHLAGPHLDYL